MNEKNNDKYNQKIDNELKKKELEKKYGMRFGQGSSISPAIESEWLNYIGEFEEQFNRPRETISVWQFIGKPEFKKAEDIKPDEISYELQKIFDIMNKANVVLDTLCEVEEKELYRFITEELFLHEMDNVRIEGMTSCFTYEEFHPNAEYDIRSAFDYFLRMTMGKMDNVGGKGYDLLYIDTKNYLDSEGNVLDKDTVTKKINNFLDSFDYFEIHSNEIKSIIVDKEKTNAELSFEIHYSGCFNNSLETMVFQGNGIIKLKPSEYGGWDMYHINMPGLGV